MLEESADLLFERFGLRRDASFLADPRLSLVDPATWASRIEPTRVLLMRARWDRIVSPDASQRLRAALGNPEQHVFPSGHSSFELFVPIAARSALAHVESRCAAVDEE
jgi:pimeloyl-ACP methyl ester carboxylesterase